MRPPRVAILVLFFAASLFLFCRSVSSLRRSSRIVAPANTQRASFTSFFSFNAPFTLFPPNAAISLTDDNSTFFPARPAAFGPPLQAKGLSGQLWIGTGFADENFPDSEGEGELGCSDLPGYEDGVSNLGLKAAANGLSAKAKSSIAVGKGQKLKRDSLSKASAVDRDAESESVPEQNAGSVDDGTDDYLHQGLATKPPGYEMTTVTSSHADIQSIQETAEITGKVVLLSRGGCGFLEKVKWAQRRGAIAVIVGDNQKGGPLIQMFARGDTSNISIPAIFTSRTTAHLLSSLMQPGSFIEDIIDENGNPALKVQQMDKARRKKKAKSHLAATPTAEDSSKVPNDFKSDNSQVTKKDALEPSDKATPGAQRSSWLSRLFRWGAPPGAVADRSRPPNSGQLDWVLVEDWNDEKDQAIRSSLEKASKRGRDAGSTGKQSVSSEDDFQIGVQDWRDPDLVDNSQADKSSVRAKDASTADKLKHGNFDKAKFAPTAKQSGKASGSLKDTNGPKGGSITPGSGEYQADSRKGKHTAVSKSGKEDDSSVSSGGLISKIFGDDDGAGLSQVEQAPKPTNTPLIKGGKSAEPIHEGLWVTITPNGSTTPFFDTLLVLVVSPLITLTMVYALLILRARIRRRRWRAPKSVVERLPVRTYHTVASTPSLTPRLPSPSSSSPTTPLLQGSSRPRPRSRTTTGVPDADALLRVDSALQGSRTISRAEHEKSHASEWKKYMSRQVECVVCLEEYVDGVSRVMSLPCGHEFHAECITPWLTTRRRTCPICKGDVVRSLARGSPSSPRYDAYHDDSSDDDIEAGGSDSGRRSSQGMDADVEQGIHSPTPRRNQRSDYSDSWFRMLSSSLGGLGTTTSSSSRVRQPEEDRDR